MTHSTLLSQLLKLLQETLQSDGFLEEFRVPGRFVRKRCLSLYQTVMFLLFYSRTTLDAKLDTFVSMFPTLEMPRVSKQALSKARYGIKHWLFKELFNISVDFYYSSCTSRKLWKDRYHPFGVDGSDLESPSSESCFKVFGKQTDHKNPDYSWSMALASTLYDILEDIVVDASLQPQFSGEREAAAQHLARLKDLGLEKNAVVIFDRGYYSADLVLECINTGCKFLMRLRNTTRFRFQRSNDEVHIITLPENRKVNCRVLRVVLSTGEEEYLITNIMDEDISCDDFRDLYFERWKIETKYLEIKEFWKMEEFSGTGVLAVCQDYYITLLHANITAILRNEADALIAKKANSRNLYQYRSRRTYSIGKVQRNLILWLIDPPTEAQLGKIVLDISQKRSQVQPGRTRDRSNRRDRAKKHYKNRKNCF